MNNPTELHRMLEKHFGFREFLEGQEQALGAVLAGRDVLVVMPTGGGKSLCYQLPSLMLQGITIVVSPLIALMKDQVDSLQEKEFPATFINSSLTQAEMDDRIARMVRGEFRLVYIAPERFKSPRFVSAISPLSIALFAVDEAHCISQWGHDFRPDYLRLKWALKDLGQPQVMALTATATPEVREDIIEQLGLGQFGRRPPQVFVSGFARHNLTLAVTRTRNRKEKLARITKTIGDLTTGIIYCATRRNVERLARDLRESGLSCVSYHGGMTDDQRTKAQDAFMSGSCPLAVATNAFGMGVDRADLRFVLHHDIPGSVEAYYQEAGRAGRDGEPARCELLYNYADIRTQEFFIEGSNPTRDIIEDLYETLLSLCADGSVEMPISEIAGQVHCARNEMAVGTSLYLLERAGFILRDYAHGSRTYTTRLAEPVRPFKELQIDFERLDGKRERDTLKLQRMIDYAEQQVCRHHFILSYFGDMEADTGCNVCDYCLSRAGVSARLPTEEETTIIQQTLSCLARMNGRFGRGRVTQTLVGSRSKEVLDAGLDRLPVYGLLSDEGSAYVWSLLDALIHAGCVAVSSGKYPTLSLTPLGHDVVQSRTSIPLAMPPRIAPKRKHMPCGKTGTANIRNESTENASFDQVPYDAELFETLRVWRRRKAAQMGNIPAYAIYPDKTLRELARRMPRTESELLDVRGIGPAKARSFGRETIGIIHSFVNRETES